MQATGVRAILCTVYQLEDSRAHNAEVAASRPASATNYQATRRQAETR